MKTDLINCWMEHPFIASVLIVVLIGLIVNLIYAVLFRLPNRLLRHLNIRKAGWPPAHCDADGDFKPEPEK